MGELGEKAGRFVKRFVHHFATWMLMPLILLVLAFFVLLAWFMALQGWCVVWFMPEGDERDCVYTKTCAYTVFAAFTTLAFLIVYLLLRG